MELHDGKGWSRFIFGYGGGEDTWENEIGYGTGGGCGWGYGCIVADGPGLGSGFGYDPKDEIGDSHGGGNCRTAFRWFYIVR